MKWRVAPRVATQQGWDNQFRKIIPYIGGSVASDLSCPYASRDDKPRQSRPSGDC